MLRFSKNPDDVFTAILEESLQFVMDEVSDLIETNDLDYYAIILVFSHKIFHPKRALETLEKLLGCHKQPELYNLNDYHYLLIYDALYLFSTIHNDRVKEAKTKKDRSEASMIDSFKIKEIDFDAMVDFYFWDTDFLMGSGDLFDLGMDKRKEIGISHEAFAISQALPPHPEELELKIYDHESQEIIKSEYFTLESKKYPDYSVE